MKLKIFLNKFNLIIFLLTIFFNNAYSIENKIILKIDNEIITTLDIENEKNYLRALNPNIKNLDKKNLNSIAKNSLIREKIKENEILKYTKTIKINQKFLEKLIKNRYAKLNLNNKNEFLNYLKNYDIDIENIEKKISIETVWNQLIYQKFSSKVKIDKNSLKKQIEETFSKGEKSYLLSEIVISANNKNLLNKKLKEIKEEISNNSFNNAALLYSNSDTSELGGKLGWINESSLNKNISEKLKNLKIKEITEPIFTANGYLILKIDDIKFIEKNYDKEKELENLIMFKTNQQLNQFSNIYFKKIKKNTNINEL